MCNLRALPLVTFAAVILFAAGDAWKTKPAAAWTQEDAREILTDSPWTKTVRASVSGLETEDQRREGGQMGQEHGVGFDGLPDDRPRVTPPASVLDIVKPEAATRKPNLSVMLQIRWESALPIRIAELKLPAVDAPVLDEDGGYRIGVYGLPGAHVFGTPKSLGEPLKKLALLRRDGKKDVRPSTVEVLQRDDGIAVVYVFPASAEILKSDRQVEFIAQIGRVAIAQPFNLEDMQFQGKLEL